MQSIIDERNFTDNKLGGIVSKIRSFESVDIHSVITTQQSSVYELQYANNLLNDSNFVFTTSPVKTKLLERSRMQITVSNFSKKPARQLTISFSSEKLQAIKDSITIEFSREESVKIINFEFIPLACGKHKLEIIATADGKMFRPMFPNFIETI